MRHAQWRPQGRTGIRAVMQRSAIAVSTLVVVAGLAVPAFADVSPASATITVAAGGNATEAKTVSIPARPTAADIEIAIDTTGSMAGSIAQARTDAINIVNGVRASVPDTQFAVIQFKDNVDVPEYQVVQAMTANSANIQTAVNGLFATGGGDAPEAYNLVYHNSATPDTGGPIGWRTGTRKFVVVIGDAEPHGAANAGIANCADRTADPHGLNTATVLGEMASAQRTLLMVRQAATASTSLACYQSQAARGFGGSPSFAVDGGGSLASTIVGLINTATSTVTDVHMAVVLPNANASWISFTPGSRGPLTPPASVGFTVNINVPAGTPAGTYPFDLVALADGADIGHQALSIVVPGGSGATNRSLQVNGTTAFADSPSSADLMGTGDWTLETWFKDESPLGFNHDYVNLINKGDRDFDREEPYTMSLGYKRLNAGFRTGAVDHVISYDLWAGRVDPTKWHHAAASYSASSHVLTLYLDGVQVAAGNLGAGSFGTSLPVEIGRNGAVSKKYFTGKLDDVRIWNAVRSPSDIAGNFMTELTSFPSSLVANWQFDDPDGTTASDSAESHTATLHGGAVFSSDVHP